MKLKQSLKDSGKVIATIVAGTALANCATPQASVYSFKPNPSANLILTELGTDTAGLGMVRRDRQEIIVGGLPLGSDIYATREQDSEGNKMAILRGQVRPLEVAFGEDLSFRAGGALKITDVGDFTNKEVGASVRINKRFSDKAKAFSDLRHYLTGNSETLTGFSYGPVSATILGGRNGETGALFARPGIWYKAHDNFSFGVEGKFGGPSKSYFGPGLKFHFGAGPKKQVNRKKSRRR